MEKVYEFQPGGVCSRMMRVTLDGEVIKKLEVVGGCNGNLKGISALVVGLTIDQVIERLTGINCREKNTSCPDQLARGLLKIKEGQLVAIN